MTLRDEGIEGQGALAGNMLVGYDDGSWIGVAGSGVLVRGGCGGATGVSGRVDCGCADDCG